MKRLVYYDEDPDGWMSAAIVLSKYADVELHQLDKAKGEFELKTGYDEVYLCDHDLRGEDQRQFIVKNNKKLIWIEHHKEAIEKAKFEYDGLQDTSHSAAYNTWKYLFPDKEMPMAVQHVSDYDIWEFKLPKTKPFMNYLQSLTYGTEVQEYLQLIKKDSLEAEYSIGEKLEEYKQSLLEQMYQTGIVRDFEGHKAMVFDGDVLRSELMHLAMQKNPEVELSVVKRDAEIIDGKMLYKYSLRSRKGSDVDVGKIASRHKGGGGHTHAAGFTSYEVL